MHGAMYMHTCIQGLIQDYHLPLSIASGGGGEGEGGGGGGGGGGGSDVFQYFRNFNEGK